MQMCMGAGKVVGKNYKGFIMKKILFFFLLFTVLIKAQVLDPPIDSTKRYNLRLYEQSAHGSAILLNEDKGTIDSVLHSLIVYTDTLQFEMVYDSVIVYDSVYPAETPLVFKFSRYMSAIDSFSTTSQTDTISITGIDSADVMVVSPIYPHGANDILSVELKADKAVIHRLASGTSGLKYNWIWIRKF